MILPGSPPPCLCLRRPTARPPPRRISCRLSPKVAQAFSPVASLSPTTLQLLRVHITLTALESTKKRQVLIVSSPRAQRKRAVIRSQGKFVLGALFGRADSHARQPSEIRASFLFAAFSASGRRAPLTTAKLLLTANRNLVCSLFSC